MILSGTTLFAEHWANDSANGCSRKMNPSQDSPKLSASTGRSSHAHQAWGSLSHGIERQLAIASG